MKGKKYLNSVTKVDKTKSYTVEEAVKLVKETSTSKFDETIEVAVRLNVDIKKGNQNECLGCVLCVSAIFLVEIGTVIKILQRSSVTKWTHSFFTDGHGVYNVIWKDLNVVVKQFDIAVKNADRSTDIFVLLFNFIHHL